MIFVLGWIIGAILAGAIGADRQCGFATPFFLSLILSPLIGIIIALASTKKSTIEFQKKILDQQSSNQARQGYEAINREGYYLELGKLEGLLEAGKITVIEYEDRKDKIKKLYLLNAQEGQRNEESKVVNTKLTDNGNFWTLLVVIVFIVWVAAQCGS